MTDRMSKEELQARVNAMSKDEAQDALTFLIGWTPEGMQEAIEFGDRVAANRARIRAERQPSPCPGGPSLPAEAQPQGEHPYPARCDVDWGSAAPSQRCILMGGHPLPHCDSTGHEWGWVREEDATACQPEPPQPRGEHPYPDAPCLSVSGENTQCTAGHASHMPPHRDLLGNEWTDAGETEGDRL